MRLAPALLVLLLWVGASAGSTLAEFKFPDPAQEQEFRELTEQLRCLVCQNESLAWSQAELAQDLRRSVYEMMIGGKSKQEIISFLVDRYGDFVLYDPPLRPATYPLWFGPLLLAGVAALFLARALVRRRRQAEAGLSSEQQQRLKSILSNNQSTDDSDNPGGRS